MKSKVECIIITCDICEEPFEDYSGYSIFVSDTDVDPTDCEWYVDNDKHYCPSCHTIDENDNLILKSNTNQTNTNQ